MGRLRGSKNKHTSDKIITSSLSTKERIFILANLIIDKIIADQKNGYQLLNKLNST